MKRFALILLLCAPMLAQKGRPLRAVVCTGGGTATAATCSPSPSLAALSDLSTTPRTIVLFTPTANNTGALTLAISGLTATAVKKYVGGAAQDPAADDLRASTSYWLEYDGTNFVIKSVLGNGGSGGSSNTEIGFISMGCYRLPVGSRVCEAGFEGTTQSAADTGTAANDPVEVTTNGSSGDKVVVNKMTPFASFSNTKLYITFRSTSTSTVTFTPRTLCSASAAALGSSFTTGTAVDVTPGASGRVETATIALTSCTPGQYMRIVVQTNAVAVGLSSAALRFHN